MSKTVKDGVTLEFKLKAVRLVKRINVLTMGASLQFFDLDLDLAASQMAA